MKYCIAVLVLFAFFSCKDVPEKMNAGYNCSAAFFDEMLVSTSLDSLVVVKDSVNKVVFATRSETTHCTQPVLEEGIFLYATISDELFQCIDIKKKQVRWSYKPPGVIYNFKLLDGFVVFSIRDFGVIVLEAKTGVVKYKLRSDYYSDCLLPLSSQDFFVKDGKLFICDFRCSDVICFDLTDCREVWKYSHEEVGICQIREINGNVFCGITGSPEKKQGLIALLDGGTGEVKFQMKEQFDLIIKPVVFKNKIIYCTYDEKIKEFNPEKLQSETLIDLQKSKRNCWSDLHLIKSTAYFIDYDFNLYSFNLESHQLKELGKAQRYLRAVGEVNGKVEFVY